LVVPTVTADGPIVFCQGDSVTLTSSLADSYSWSPNGETTQSITVYVAGDYSVSVVNEDGCEGISASTTVTMFQVDPASITADGPLEFCADGSVKLTASLGSSYVWLPNGETAQWIIVSDAGTYSVTVTNENGCESSSADILVTVFDLLTPIVSADGPLTFCEGGSVTLTSSEAESYAWAPFGQTTQSVILTESGIYRVTVTDENGCQATSDPIQIIVNENPEPVITANGPTEFCDGDSVILTSSSADSYLWSSNSEVTQSITVLTSGTYSVTVIDQNGCEGEALAAVEVTVFIPDPVSITVDGASQFCDGDSVVLTASQGDSYSWMPNGENTQSITVFESGNYIVIVTDANGCELTSDAVTVTVFDLPEPVVSLSGPSILCEGDSVILTATQSDAYLWYPDGQTTQSITVYVAGLYAVGVTDANTCVAASDTVDITVHEATEINITAGGTTQFCDGGNVVLTATGGQSYYWNPNSEQTQSITVSESGEYVVSVVDANGCSYDSDTIEVVVFDLPTVSVNVTGSIIFCEGESADLLAVSPDAVTYEWLENGSIISGENGATLTVVDSSPYTVIVTDTNGCTATDNAPIITVGAVPIAVVSEDKWMCAQGEVTLTASGGENYVWSNGETGSSITVSPDSVTNYIVTVSNQFCSTTSSDSVLVSLYPSPNALIGASSIGQLEVDVEFNDISGDSSIVDWLWDFGDGEFEVDQNTEHSFSNEEFFIVILTVENEFGCVDTDTVEIEITQIIDIPNVFTPNGDGYNDHLFFGNFGVDEYELTIYNRWGLIMHYDASGEIFWDGRTPAGAEAEAGTYYYTLNVLNEHSLGDFKQNGAITLIR